jgi:glycosyltransferase involved in cell wall biosynthesis
MKIIFFIDCLGPGGKERRLTELMKALKHRADLEFELAITQDDIHYKVVYELGIKIYKLIRRRKKDFSILKQLYDVCVHSKPDILHCWDSMTAIYSVPICKLLNIKLVNGMVTDTLVSWKYYSKSWLRARITFPFSDLIIGNSNAGLRAYEAKKRKSVCIYNGFNFERLNNLKKSSLVLKEVFGDELEDIFIVGMVAAFEERKDYSTFINSAIVLCNDPSVNYRFIMIGQGSTSAELRKKVPESLLTKIVFLNSRSDVESLINVFDIGVLLTNSKVHGEGISNSILEYMALGKPVIATSGGGTNEIVSDNYNGFLIPVGDEAKLTDHIVKLYKDRNMVNRLGKNGKKTIQERFNIDLMVNNYIDVYNKLLDKSLKS